MNQKKKKEEQAEQERKHPSLRCPQIHGVCMGVDLLARGPNDNHVEISLSVEDDTNWHRKMRLSSFWLDELITILTKARKELKTKKYEPDTEQNNTWGYRFASPKKSRKKSKRKIVRNQ